MTGLTPRLLTDSQFGGALVEDERNRGARNPGFGGDVGHGDHGSAGTSHLLTAFSKAESFAPCE